MNIKEKIKKTKEHLFKMQEQLHKIKSGIALMETNDSPKLAVEKCIEMLNYIEGNIQTFDIPFENKKENIDDKDTEDNEDNEEDRVDEDE